MKFFEIYVPGLEFSYRDKHWKTKKRVTIKARLPVPKGNDSRVIRRGPNYSIAPSERVVAAQAAFAKELRKNYSGDLLACAVRVDLAFMFEVPSGWPLWKQDAALKGRVYADGHNLGDLDQLAKLALDAAEDAGILKDDCKVVRGHRSKHYAPHQGILLSFTVLPAAPTSAKEWAEEECK